MHDMKRYRFLEMQLEQRCKALVVELGLGTEQDIREVLPLTGGVASDIAMVDLGTRKICVKFALPRLKVAADWQAPVHRNAAEYAWLKVAADILPHTAIRLFGQSERAHGFAMEYVEGDDVYLWKDHLLAEAEVHGEASKVADLLGTVHSVSARRTFDRSAFRNRDDFRALRIEPYLSFTRCVHQPLGSAIQPLEEMLYESQSVLVHGDVSPKNILFRGSAPIILDAECATMGDASFDPAFCLNHVVLKAIHLPRSRRRLLGQVSEFWSAYTPHISWENPEHLEGRVCALLPILMLARVDGKSPVEYLSERERQTVRDISMPLIASPPARLSSFVAELERRLRGDDK